ncbi:hypothetical protein R3W88_024377 [Solanum pinnatisectum]|uniref:Ribosomal protein S19 n=1 Tax=Solanum pinnatisectum TaxID=50273 RepID=A0AAV9M3F0_9SOLN|nr:hypothetical protein R3W88_024377 [Solanum pinnatisectum]
MRQRRALRRVSQKERPPKLTTTKIGIVIRSVDHPFLENHFWGLPPFRFSSFMKKGKACYR